MRSVNIQTAAMYAMLDCRATLSSTCWPVARIGNSLAIYGHFAVLAEGDTPRDV